MYTTGSCSRAWSAPRKSYPRQTGWEKLVEPFDESTPSALAGPGVSRPTAATEARENAVMASTPSSNWERVLRAASGPSKTRLGLSTMSLIRKVPSVANTVALTLVPPTSRPTTTAGSGPPLMSTCLSCSVSVLRAVGRDDAQSERVPQLYGRADQIEIPLSIPRDQTGNEAAVELQLAHGEVAQVGERGDAGSEVVDGNDHPQPLQFLDDGPGGVDLGDHTCLRDLNHQRLPRHSVTCQGISDHGHEARLQQGGGGDVDGDADPASALAPVAALAACLVKHPLRDAGHQSGLLRRRQELDRSQETQAWMRPPDQGLHREDLPVPQVQLGLIVEDELVLVDGHVQLFQEAHLVTFEVQSLLVAGDRNPTQLRSVHGDVGAPDEPGGVDGIGRGHGDADAGADRGRDDVQDKGLLQTGGEPLGHHLRLVQIGIGQEDRKFVAAEPHGQIRFADGARRPNAQLLQEGIAGGVSKGVIDLLESIEIDE